MNTPLSGADASFLGENMDDNSGEIVAGVGDVNEDGGDDIIIVAVYNGEKAENAGQVYLILGLPNNDDPTSNPPIIPG